MRFYKARYLTIMLFVCIVLGASNAKAASVEFTIHNQEVIVEINGKIKDGDYSKFKEVVTEAFETVSTHFRLGMESAKKNAPKKYAAYKQKTGDIGGIISMTVSLNSNGGDLSEAIKIGRAIRQMGIKTKTANFIDKPVACNSACFFIWVSMAI